MEIKSIENRMIIIILARVQTHTTAFVYRELDS